MVAFSLFGISIYWYGIFYFLAFVFGYVFFLFLKKYSFLEKYGPKLYSLLKRTPEDIILYVIVGLLIGGRLGHIFIYDFSFYIHHPLRIFAVWEGGMSFIGGILGVVFSLILLFRKNLFAFRDFFLLTDLLIVPVSFGIMLGRIGNFLNQELYGRLVSDVFPSLSSSLVSFFSRIHIFYVYDRVDSFLRINTNFLASFFEGFLLFVISSLVVRFSLRKKRRTIGFLSSFFLVWYSLIRFLFEYIRMDSQSEYIFWFTKSQWFFIGFFCIGLFFMYRSLKHYIK